MSATTNIINRARSGEKNIINIGFICDLADLAVKAGMKTLRVGIDKLFIDIFYHFNNSYTGSKSFRELWCILLTFEPEVIVLNVTEFEKRDLIAQKNKNGVIGTMR